MDGPDDPEEGVKKNQLSDKTIAHWFEVFRLWACERFECRTRFKCSLPLPGGIMSHHYMIAGNNTVQPSVARTRGLAVRVWPPAP